MDDKRILGGLLASLASLSFSGGSSPLALEKAGRRHDRLYPRNASSGVRGFVKRDPVASLFGAIGIGGISAVSAVALSDYMLYGGGNFIDEVLVPLIYKRLEKEDRSWGNSEPGPVRCKYRFLGNRAFIVDRLNRNNGREVRNFENIRLLLRKSSSFGDNVDDAKKNDVKKHLEDVKKHLGVVSTRCGARFNYVIYGVDGFRFEDLPKEFANRGMSVYEELDFFKQSCDQLIDLVMSFYKVGWHCGIRIDEDCVFSIDDAGRPVICVSNFRDVFEIKKDGYNKSDIDCDNVPGKALDSVLCSICCFFKAIFGTEVFNEFFRKFPNYGNKVVNLRKDLKRDDLVVQGSISEEANFGVYIEFFHELVSNLSKFGG